MRRLPQPILYLRVASGGRVAAQAQEAAARRLLEEVAIDHRPMHVSCDIDLPGCLVGPALGLLLEEAQLGMVGTLISMDVARLASQHAALVRVLTLLEGAGVEIVTLDYLRDDLETCARLRREGQRYSDASGLLSLSFGSPVTQELR